MKLKKGVKYVLFGIIFLFVISLIFCGNKSLVGTWKGRIEDGDISNKFEITFRKNGSGIMVQENKDGEVLTQPFSFELFDGDKLIIHEGEYEEDASQWKYEIKGRKLKITNQYGGEVKLKKKIF